MDENFNLNKLFGQTKFLDLTHTLNSSIPTWNGSCGFEHAVKMDYDQGCRVQNIKMHAGVGTHMDAASHFFPNAASISDIPIEQLIAPICVINITNKDPRYQLSEQDILAYESNYGKISKNSFVIAYTGWDQYWPEPQKYRNEDSNGNLIFPSFSAQSAEMLIERNIAGIGIDTLSPDRSDTNFPVHRIVLGANKYIVENLAHCKSLPAKGAYSIILPLKVQEGTESAVRAIALLPK